VNGQPEYSYEDRLVREIAWCSKRSEIVAAYREAMNSHEKIDWDKIHRAIVERWSHFAVEWIRREANRQQKRIHSIASRQSALRQSEGE